MSKSKRQKLPMQKWLSHAELQKRLEKVAKERDQLRTLSDSLHKENVKLQAQVRSLVERLEGVTETGIYLP